MSRRPIHFHPPAAEARCASAPIDGLRTFHRSLPGYAPTPLTELPTVAQELGVRAVFVKDESNRFGLPSFKALGASWGCYRAVARRLGLSATVGLDELSARAQEAKLTLFAATEGNHGRAVAFMAKLLAIRARIYVPRGMDNSTRQRIASEGAEVIMSPGNYDRAVREAAEASAIDGGILIQDTAFVGYEDVPAWIVEGYSTMLEEAEEQLESQGLQCSVMFTPVGVGSLAHAVARFCKSRETPMSVVAVEPDTAPCLYASMKAREPVTVSTSSTIMDGMNCGTVSSTAWPDLQKFADACVTVSCYESHMALQELAQWSVTAGPCGGASLAALRRMVQENKQILSEDSVVVLLSTEGPRPYATPRRVSVEDAVGLTQVLTGIDSSNSSLSVADGAGENEAANYIAAWFAHRDIQHHRVETVPGRPSIVGVLPGSGGGSSLMFNGHIDTVTLSSYEGDALLGAVEERKGRQVVLGRGTMDMKGGLAAALAAVASTKASGNIPRGDVIIAAVSDEEDKSQGTQDVIAAGWRADAAVVPEPTMGEIITAHKGFFWVEVDILGVAAHGSDPTQGQDAILSAGWFLRALDDYQHRLPVDDTLGQASLHCGLIQGGQEPSSYPAKCMVTVEFRTVPSQTEETVLGDLNKMLQDIASQKPGFNYASPRITMSRPTHKLPVDHPLVQTAAACAARVSGNSPAISNAKFWCDASLLSAVGIPSIVYGPKGEGLHSKEEWVEVESLQEMAGVFEQMIQEMCQ
ncbi:hypothetical protein FE257_012210 [Aspergillus nanangensis]|uniref:Diaminopropionate ammonia-lyase n=1 Tax=Aspergillus nanangensis TaxID=2582783 RepID=A0AAD4CG86_ASPNN|nr:hypothetical protein FE257_012210 [Aspergillus nanangensis]